MTPSLELEAAVVVTELDAAGVDAGESELFGSSPGLIPAVIKPPLT